MEFRCTVGSQREKKKKLLFFELTISNPKIIFILFSLAMVFHAPDSESLFEF